MFFHHLHWQPRFLFSYVTDKTGDFLYYTLCQTYICQNIPFTLRSAVFSFLWYSPIFLLILSEESDTILFFAGHSIVRDVFLSAFLFFGKLRCFSSGQSYPVQKT